MVPCLLCLAKKPTHMCHKKYVRKWGQSIEWLAKHCLLPHLHRGASIGPACAILFLGLLSIARPDVARVATVDVMSY